MATTKPSIFTWATGAASTREDPGAAKKAAGWQENEAPGAKVFNWLQNYFTSYIAHNNERGISAWDASTDYVIGALASYQGAVWKRATAGSGGAAPSAAASPWDLAYAAPLGANVTVNVPTDYPTLQEAFDAYRYSIPNGHTVVINIEAGHSPASGLLCKHGNFGFISITSANNEVTVASGWNVADNFINCDEATGPTLDTVINMGNLGGTGLNVRRSQLVVNSGAGVKNAGTIGVQAYQGSTVYAEGAVFSGAGTYGVRALTASRVVIRGGDANAAGNVGIASDQCSVVDAENSTATGAGAVGMQASGGTIMAKGSTATGATEDYAVINGGIMQAHNTSGNKNIAVNTLLAQGVIFA